MPEALPPLWSAMKDINIEISYFKRLLLQKRAGTLAGPEKKAFGQSAQEEALQPVIS